MEALMLLLIWSCVLWWGWIAAGMLWEMIRNLFRKLPDD